jgi:putative aldouronate transport system permease protein
VSARRVPWEEPPSLAGRGLKGLTLAVVLLFIGFPLYVVVLTSLSPQRAVTEAGGLVVVPDGLTVGAYQEILTGGVVTRAVLVSLGVTLVGTALSVVVSVLAAYGLSQLGSFGHRPLLFTMLITLFFGAGIIPNYLVVKGLGMIDTYWSLILPSAVSVFNILVMRTFFMNLPAELLDSARVDGAGDVRILLRIVLPLSKAVTAVVALFYAVGYWNAFFNAMLYINTNSKWPLQLVLRTYVLQGTAFPGNGLANQAGSGHVASLAVQMAVVVLSLVPVLLIYPFVQKHFTKGVLIGAVKG